MAPDNGGNKNEKQEKLFRIKKSLKVGKNFYSKFTLLLIPVCINKDLFHLTLIILGKLKDKTNILIYSIEEVWVVEYGLLFLSFIILTSLIIFFLIQFLAKLKSYYQNFTILVFFIIGHSCVTTRQQV